MNQKIKVVYIMGWGRSGSTILANILGELEGFLSGGEIQAIWEWGFTRKGICGCGKPFLECGFWSRVTDAISKRAGPMKVEKWNGLCRKETRTLQAPEFFLSRDRTPHSPALREYLSVTEILYEAIQQTSGCKVIVDSSKSPFYGSLLRLIPQIEVYTLHLIRDPRAATYSWSVPKPQPEAPMSRIGAVQSSILWTVWNASAEWFQLRSPDRCLCIRYEDFIRRPRPTVEKILDFIGEHPDPLPFMSDSSVFLGPNHMLRANPCRFTNGKVDLKEDIRWKTEMKLGKRWVTAFLTWPLALRYGYFFSKTQSPPGGGTGLHTAL